MNTRIADKLPADALTSTVYRTTHDSITGWRVCYHNNDDLVTAWRAEGGALTEATGYVESGIFHAQSMRVVAGAVDAYGGRTLTPGPWSRQVPGKVRYQYTLAGAAQLRADGFTVDAEEITA